MSYKFERNEECPCGSGKKYKKCCINNVNWSEVIKYPNVQYSQYLTLRGKNIQFFNTVLGILQIDKFAPNTPFSEYKKAFTPNTVRRIYELVDEFWPNTNNYVKVITENKDSTTALYTGTYDYNSIIRAVTRHSMYSEKIYLIDPFVSPSKVNDEFNPVLHPEYYRADAIKWTNLWFALFPWIDAGIINFIRPLDEFVPGLYQEVIKIQHTRFENNPELKKILETQTSATVDNMEPLDSGPFEHYILSHPDDYFRDMYRNGMFNTFKNENDFLKYIQQRKDAHPYHVDRLPDQVNSITYSTTGANYELAKRICGITNSHLITDLKSRWKEIEIDRSSAGIDDKKWSTFAKALQNSELKILDSIPLSAALRLRQENRLESLRLFFRKIWKSCKNVDDFSEENSINLSSELADKIREAKSEWNKIDQDLLKWLGGTSGALLSAGLVGWVPAAAGAVGTGVTGLIQSHLKRNSFKDQYPAGFFLSIGINSF